MNVVLEKLVRVDDLGQGQYGLVVDAIVMETGWDKAALEEKATFLRGVIAKVKTGGELEEE